MAFRGSSPKSSASSCSEQSGGESDDDNRHWKRVRRNQDMPDLVPVDEPKPNIDVQPATNNQQKRKVNTIWADVNTEQQILCGLSSSVTVVTSKNTVNRGPESYPRIGAYDRIPQSEFQKNQLDKDLDLYLSQQDELFKNEYIEAAEPFAPESDVVEKRNRYNADRFSGRKRQHGADFRLRHVSPGARFLMTFGVNLDKTLPLDQLAAKMADALHEPKVELISSCLSILGIDKALELYRNTEVVEKNGGMMTFDKKRRRTSGGVFLQLMRDDPTVSEDAMQKIFANERNNERKMAKARRRVKRQMNFEDYLKEAKDKIIERKTRRDTDEMDDGGCCSSKSSGRSTPHEWPHKKDVFLKEALAMNENKATAPPIAETDGAVDANIDEGEIVSSDEEATALDV